MTNRPSRRTVFQDDAVGLDEFADEQLMRRYQAGQQDAFAHLVHRYERELYSYLRRMIGNEALAEDAFQATFLQVHLKQELYEPKRPFRPWLYTIATHQAIDLLRRNRRHRHASLDREAPRGDDAVSAPTRWVESGAPGPAHEAERLERIELVRSGVGRLAEHLRSVVLMAYYQGMKYKEISEALRIPVGTVKSRLHAAVRRLAKEWTRLGLSEN